MKPIRHYKIIPSLPKELLGLQELAFNLYWTWDNSIQNLFRRLDRNLWSQFKNNPVSLLGNIEQNRLEYRSKDDGYLNNLNRGLERLQDYLTHKSWYKRNYEYTKPLQIAYFSMEYGLAPALPIYSGGLGILAGDHLKSASDLGLPFVGVGLLYQEGYFHQYLTNDGWQQETYPKNDFYNMPIHLLKQDNQKPIIISIDLSDRKVYAQIWKAKIGRIELYLLDTNVSKNSPEDQKITDRLYGGNTDQRIKQEILLGIGGIRALSALGIEPHVCHMNEGHSAFMALERTRMLMQKHGLSFSQAHEAIRGGTLFTSHTPVPAGIDVFDPQLVDYYLGNYYKELNISEKEFHELGGVHLEETEGKFNMAIFAINMSGYYNGVSRLHGHVTRNMWSYLWKKVPIQDIPISNITNGIHLRSWISADLSELFDHYLGPKWYQNPTDKSVWARIQQIPDEELWRTHERRREQLVAFAREHLKNQLVKSGSSESDIQIASEVLNPKALTIGFGRRFAQYKRAYLLFRDIDRLKELLNSQEFPVQILYAGKAHPQDNIGKGIIRDIITTIRHGELRNKIVFLEDYDMRIASYLLSGVDVWLNTPRRNREASGTSGMKAGANGALNVSVLDGWWDEAYTNEIGWAIGRGETYANDEEQDMLESESLYYLLENEIMPLFYQRGSSSLPRKWISMMKASIQTLCPNFSTHRMVKEYFETFYLPAYERWNRLTTDKMKAAITLVNWKKKIRENWDQVKIIDVKANTNQDIRVGESFEVLIKVFLNGLLPQDIKAQVYYGELNAEGEIEKGMIAPMQLEGETDKTYNYKTTIPCHKTGQHGFSIRLLPFHPELTNPFELGLIKWESDLNQNNS